MKIRVFPLVLIAQFAIHYEARSGIHVFLEVFGASVKEH